MSILTIPSQQLFPPNLNIVTPFPNGNSTSSVRTPSGLSLINSTLNLPIAFLNSSVLQRSTSNNLISFFIQPLGTQLAKLLENLASIELGISSTNSFGLSNSRLRPSGLQNGDAFLGVLSLNDLFSDNLNQLLRNVSVKNNLKVQDFLANSISTVFENLKFDFFSLFGLGGTKQSSQIIEELSGGKLFGNQMTTPLQDISQLFQYPIQNKQAADSTLVNTQQTRTKSSRPEPQFYEKSKQQQPGKKRSLKDALLSVLKNLMSKIKELIPEKALTPIS